MPAWCRSLARPWLLLGAGVVCGGCASPPAGPRAAELLAQGHIIEAERAFRAQVAADPSDGAARDGLGAALAAQDNFEQACPLLAIDSTPLPVHECWLKAMEVERQRERWAMVVAYARRSDPSGWPHAQQVRYYKHYSEALRRLRDDDALLTVYPKMLSVTPEDPEIHYYYARTLEARGNSEQAMREYELVLQLDPQRTDVERYIKRLEATVRASGRGTAGRVEYAKLPAAATTTAPSRMKVEDWSQGSVVAAISVDAMGAGGHAGAVTAGDIELQKAHWPAQVKPQAVLEQIASYAGAFKCPLPTSAFVVVTWGPDGMIKTAVPHGVPEHSLACVRRGVNGWLLPELRGGFLQIKTPIATAGRMR